MGWGCFMQRDNQQYFERSDKWHYRLLLQELYRNCVLSSHDSYAFNANIQKLDKAVTNFPGLDIRDMIDKLMSPYKQELFDSLVARKYRYRKVNSGQPIAEMVSLHFDEHDLYSKYFSHLFDTLRDCLSIYGAFNLSKQEKEHGYELPE